MEDQTQNEKSRLEVLREKMNDGTGLNIEEKDEYDRLVLEENGGQVENSGDNSGETTAAEGDEAPNVTEPEQQQENSEETTEGEGSQEVSAE